jgi:folate-binding protein YgfZ
MNAEWQLFLQQQHANISEGIVEYFGDTPTPFPEIQNIPVLCDLSQFGLLKVSGEEAQSFLQNLLSSDVREVSNQQAQISSLNTAKGRMLATFLLWQTGTDYFLHLPNSLCSAILKRLSMYILRTKVKIEFASDQQICLGVCGEGATTLLQQHFGTVPQTALSTEQHDTANIIRVSQQQFLIHTTLEHAPALWLQLAASALSAGSVCWDWYNIRNGIPVVTPTTQEQFVPQMANLELIGGVNFKKGCYPGQEIVARMQYLGKSKRRMYLAHINGKAQPGEPLFSAEGESQNCGMVANASIAPDGGCDLLAVVMISTHDTQSIHLGSLEGEALQFLPLPYAIPA